jgi:OFA family oxalate/formate antiporter-like MFS transporter
MAVALTAATILNLPFGTIYAFSVFLKPMEALLAISRVQMSVVFALATITLTLGMNLAPRLYRRLPPALLVAASCVGSATGLVLTANAQGFAGLLVGYGLMFGVGGGICFIVMQQAVNQAQAAVSGLVNGYLVSLYPLGAMLGAPVFGWAIGAYGLRITLAGLAGTVLVTGMLAALLLHSAKIRLHDPAAVAVVSGATERAVFLRLFAVFFLAAAAGLTVLSQAAGIVQAYGGKSALALGATTFITGAIAAARTGGGALVDRFAVPHVACAAHLWSLGGALMLVVWPGPWVAVAGLAMIGMGYGFVSGLTAGAISRYWHRNLFGQIASRMYIAWCIAAISLPVLAGWLFDRTQGYAAVMMIAAAVNLLGVAVALRLPPGADAPRSPAAQGR